jgi:hypothetical protein
LFGGKTDDGCPGFHRRVHQLVTSTALATRAQAKPVFAEASSDRPCQFFVFFPSISS